jgi:hypothetical protein
MANIKYRIYPTLLNEYAKYLHDPSTEKFNQLLNRINRISDFDEQTLLKFKKGIRFEEAVVKNMPHNFEPAIINNAKALLPKARVLQMPVKFNHNAIQFYGFADVVGEGRVIDLKTTSSYKNHKFKDNPQNLYMYALKNQGCVQMEYIVYDFSTIHHEIYRLESYDFKPLLGLLDEFSVFLEKNRHRITDPKLFVKEQREGLFD